MEAQHTCPKTPDSFSEKHSDEQIQDKPESCFKKPEEPFKVPAMTTAKLTVSKPVAKNHNTSDITASTGKGATAAPQSLPACDSGISQTDPGSDGFAVPTGVVPRPPAGSPQSSKPSAPPPPPPKTLTPDSRPGTGATPTPAPAAAAYRPPAWSGCPPEPYSLEVLRGGQIVDTVSLRDRPAVVFGRLPDCDVRLEHPSISRHHAALVYRASSEGGHDTGYYLYDLGSTHGTTLNKAALQPRVYCRMRVGHMCKFGGSTRLFILQGPEEDQEEESDLTVTELKELGERRREQQERRLEELDSREREPEPEPKIETKRVTVGSATDDDGISWGMAEDADEEADLPFNPFALGEAENEQLYLIDPKRTLRGWFEREGHELEYETEEMPGARHVCRISLPLDTADGVSPVAEVQHVGKKKEAVFQCALEACRMLDRAGVLRQAKQESRQSRRRRPAGYDSDEDDTFLDRTGAVERKRQRRQQQAGKEEPKADTYQSLLSQYERVRSEAAALEHRLQQADSAARPQPEPAGDELDDFMTRLSRGAIGDGQERRQLRTKLSQLRTEEGRLCRLVNMARPAELPPLRPPPQAGGARAPLTGFIGKRRGKAGLAAGRVATAAAAASASPPVSASDRQQQRLQDAKEAANECTAPAATKAVVARPAAGSDGDADSGSANGRERGGANEDTGSVSPPAAEARPRLQDTTADERPSDAAERPSNQGGRVTDAAQSPPKDQSNRPVVGPALPCDASLQEDRQKEAAAEKKPKSKARRRDKQATAAPAPYSALAGDGSYDVWVPPEGQTGDGRTSLNDKLGY